MSKLKIDLDFWAEQARNDDPTDVADTILQDGADWIYVMLEGNGESDRTNYDGMQHAMRKYPELVKTHAIANAVSRFEHTYRILKIEELRLLEGIANSLKSIASAAASSEDKSDE